jgi:hypothetical protein
VRAETPEQGKAAGGPASPRVDPERGRGGRGRERRNGRGVGMEVGPTSWLLG